MDITNLSIRNFLTIGQAELQLDGRGLVLIQGENTDDTSAASNGAGKSSIVDAICWALYGTTARDVSTDDVINVVAKKDCKVEVNLDDAGTLYRVTRYRKDKVHKNQVFVHQVDAAGVATDISKGTDKETQDVIRKIMGCSLEVFRGAIYAGQEAMPDLPGMTDKQLKLLIEEAAGVEELSAAYTEAARLALGAKKDFDAAGAHVRMLQQRLDTINTDLAEAEAQHQLFEDGRKDRARTELAKAKPLSDQITSGEGLLAAHDLPALNAKKADLSAKLAGRRTEEAELARLQTAARNSDRLAAAAHAAATSLKRESDRLEADLANIDAKIGAPCGECGKPYCAHDMEAARVARATSITAKKTELALALREYKAAKGVAEAATKAVTDFAGAMTDVSAASAELAKVNSDLAVVASLTAQLDAWRRSADGIRETAKGKLTEPNGWQRVVDSKREDRQRVENEIGRAQDETRKLEGIADLYDNASKVFGPAGVRAHILDTVTPFLNAQTTEYLGALADGNIHATWSTLSKTAKGELKEKFNIEVENDKGGKSFKALSGGEKRKVRIAANMALQDMVASRAEKPINLWIGDEIDHALDEPGLERLMTVLDRKAKERGTVLVISHNALTDWIDNVITVQKAGGVSSVTGATHRGF